jgi:F-type H+-transporting ATPase subunit gamma
MANTRQVKRRITTAKNISKITKAMEMVAASKMRRAQAQAVAARPYALELFRSLRHVAQRVDAGLHPLLTQHAAGQRVVVIVGTDKGLCGSLNTRLFRELLVLKEQLKDDPIVIAVGKKTVLFCRLAGLKVYAQFTDLPEKIGMTNVLPITSLVIEKFLDQTFSSVDIIYMDFVNTLKQTVKVERLLPISKEIVATSTAETVEANEAEYLFEPSAQDILDILLPFYIENTVYHAFLEGKASEHSARMVSMKNASENAADLVQELLLVFNKGRQQAITSELLDITTASLTLA